MLDRVNIDRSILIREKITSIMGNGRKEHNDVVKIPGLYQNESKF